ncbi:ABC transporter permease [Streptomyces thermolineatus]|uniref:ABC transporter permease n=1 Tax=Streptomyces thermolineatus TaxID=44033 RepID=UPI0038500FEE
MFEIARKTLRARKAAFLGAFVALFCGTAVIAASGILVESGLRTTVRPERYAAAAVVVGGDQILRIPGGDFTVAEPLPERARLSKDVLEAVASVPGVASVVGDRSFPVTVLGPEGGSGGGGDTGSGSGSGGGGGDTGAGAGGTRQAFGHGWESARLAPFELADGRAPRTDSEVVLDTGVARAAGVRAGDEVRIATASVPAVYRVSGTAVLASGGPPERQRAVFFTPDEAARLSAVPDRFDAVGVLAREGTDPDDLAEAVERAADDAASASGRDTDGTGGTDGTGVTVRTGTDTARLEFPDVDASQGLLLAVAASFGGTALLVAVFVVAGTLALSVGQRRREFAVLRAIGSTPQQILGLVVAESLIVALVAGVLGCLPGAALAEVLRRLFARLGVVPADLPLSTGPLPLLGAVVLTALTAVAAGLVAAHRPARINPVDAMGEAAVERPSLPGWRAALGVLCLLLGLGAAAVPLVVRSEVGSAGTGGGALLCVVGLTLLGPAVVRVLVRVVGAPLRAMRVSGFLAVANSTAALRRMSSAVMPLVLAVGFTVTLVHTQTTLASAAEVQVEQGLKADWVLAGGGAGGLAPRIVRDVRAVPGVAAVTAVTTTKTFLAFTLLEDRELAGFPTRGVSAGPLDATVDLGVVEGSTAGLRGRTAAMEHSQAKLLGLGVGDELELYLGDGTPAPVRLVATYERSSAFGEMTVPQELLEGHTGAGAPEQLLVRARPGADRDEVESSLRALAGKYPTLSVLGHDGFSTGVRAESVRAAWINLAGLGLILGYVAVAVVNTLVVATAGRSREFALMRLVGMTRRQVLRTLRWEAVLLCAVAVLLGTAVAAVPLALLNLGFLGTPLPAGPPLVYGAVVTVTVLLGVLSVMLPVRLALRTRPVDAIGVRE